MSIPVRSKTTQYFLFSLILLAAFALRMWGLQARSLWLDEAMEYWVAASPPPDLLQSVRSGLQDPPLYSLLLHGWMRFGQSEAYLRFLSVCFSLLSISGLIRLSRSLSGWGAALTAGLLVSLLPINIRYAQETGQYALMSWLLVWNLLFLQRIRRYGRRRDYGLWTVTAIAGVYSYYGAVFTLFAPFGSMLAGAAFRKQWSRVSRGLGAVFVCGAAILPLLLFFLPEQLFRGPTATAFSPEILSPAGEFNLWLASTQALIAYQLTGWPQTTIPQQLPFILTAGAMILAAIKAVHFAPNRSRLLLGWLGATWGVYYIAGKLGVFPYGFRYSLILTPLLILVVADGLAPPFPRQEFGAIGRFILLPALVTICLLSLPNRPFRDQAYHYLRQPQWPEIEDVRLATQYWMTHRQAAVPTYVYYGAAPTFQYYLRLYELDDYILPPPNRVLCRQEANPQDCGAKGVYYGAWLRSLSPEQKLHSIQATLGHRPAQTWLIFSHVHLDEEQTILRQLLKHYRIRRSYQATGASVYLLEQW